MIMFPRSVEFDLNSVELDIKCVEFYNIWDQSF